MPTLNPFTPKVKNYVLPTFHKETMDSEAARIGSISSIFPPEEAMKSQVLHTVCDVVSGEAAGEI